MDDLSVADPLNALRESIDQLAISPTPVAADRKWADLPRDVLSLIFRKVGAIDVMNAAQWVCRPWRRLARKPQTWLVVDMTAGTHIQPRGLATMAREVIARSNGLMEEFYAKRFVDDGMIKFIANRTNGVMRRLGLIGCNYNIYGESVIEFVKRSPDLEYLEIPFSAFNINVVHSLGNSCPKLRHFLVEYPPRLVDFLPIIGRRFEFPAGCMKELRYLRVVGYELTADVLNSILDSCHHLVSLDISLCRTSIIDDSLRKKFSTLASVSLPIYYDDEDDYLYFDYNNSDFEQFSDDDDCSEIFGYPYRYY